MRYSLTAVILASSLSLCAQNTLYVKNTSKWPCRVFVALGSPFPVDITEDSEGKPILPRNEVKIVETQSPMDGMMYTVRGNGMTSSSIVEGTYSGNWTLVLKYKRKLKYWKYTMEKRDNQ